MQTVERASLFITRWLARHPFSEAVKFDDDEIQNAVIVLEELNHWLPINFRYTGGSTKSNFLTESVELGFIKNGGHSLRLTDDGAKPRN